MADGEGGGPFFVVKGVERGSMFLKPLVNKLNLRKNANKLLHLILRPLDPPPPQSLMGGIACLPDLPSVVISPII